MHYARLDNSPRLQRVAALLANGQWHTTMEIIVGANVCAVNSAIAELRANGLAIESKRAGDVWSYRLVQAFVVGVAA